MGLFRGPFLKQLLVSVLLVGAATASTYALTPLFQGRAPLLMFVLAVIGAAVYGGLLPGLLTTALSVVLVRWWFEKSIFTFVMAQGNLPAFTFLGVSISL